MFERKTIGESTPIVGERYSVKRWTLTVTIECRCGHHQEAVLLVGSEGAIPGSCHQCGSRFDLGGVSWDGTQFARAAPRFAIAHSLPVAAGN